MILAANGGALGGHLAGWRHRDAHPRAAMRLEAMVATAVLAEQGGLDMMFLADGNGVRQMDKPGLFAATSPSDRPAVFEPVTLFAALSQHTKHLGFVATATTSFEEPYSIARKFASLDHISGGRAAWNLVTTQYVEDAKNFNRDEHMGRAERYERARESLDVVRTLWDSWAGDAFVQDKATGQYLDPARVRLTNHRGRHFQVKGPLNVGRTPQGRPVVFMAGQSEAGKDLAAYGADAIFGAASGKEEARREYADIKGRMAAHGRHEDELKILPGMSVLVGRSEAEADELFEELQSLIPVPLALAFLTKVVGTDVTALPLDGPMPPPAGPALGGTAIGRSVGEMAVREGLTVRQTYQRILPSMNGTVARGTASQVADVLEDWFRAKACDGFVLSFPVQPRSLRDFVELVVPELRRRGLRPPSYRGATLRENMGLARPADPWSR